METVLDCKTVTRGFGVRANELGLFDVAMQNEHGSQTVRNLTREMAGRAFERFMADCGKVKKDDKPV